MKARTHTLRTKHDMGNLLGGVITVDNKSICIANAKNT